jgi:fumarate hydratase class II
VAAFNLWQEISLLGHVSRNFAVQCIAGITATSRGPELVERGLAIGTALAPVVGYDRAAAIAKEASATGQTIREVARQRTDLTDADLDRLLDPEKMVQPGLGGGPAGG